MEGITRLFFKITNKDINVYRNFSFERPPKIFIPDHVLGNKLIPNVTEYVFTSDFCVIYKTNSMGLREKEIEDTAKFKILFLGDSFTFGVGIPYGSRFSDLIEKEIKNVYTINSGVPGYGIHQMYLWLRGYGMNLKPNLVICSIIPLDLDRSIYKKIEDSPHLLISKQENEHHENKILYLANSFKKISDRLLIKSYFYSMVKVKIRIIQMLFYLKERDKKFWDVIKKNGDRGRYKITTDEQREMVKEESSKIFIDFKDMCDRAQVKFLVVNISKESLPWLTAFFLKHNIEFLDLSPQLKKNSNINFEIDPHYNRNGHRIIADLLVDYILERYKDNIA